MSTPGPWVWWNNVELVGGEHETLSVIEPEVSCGAYCLGGVVRLDISPADRRLIAAAPDMLEALEFLEKLDADEMPSAAREAVRSALRKVRGAK